MLHLHTNNLQNLEDVRELKTLPALRRQLLSRKEQADLVEALLVPVRRVLDDIKRPTHTQRQWEGQVSAVAALQPHEEADALSFERQAEKERDP